MTRSENMSKIKSKNNKNEVYLRKLLWKEGIRYYLNYTKIPGKPDIFVSKYKTAIFVNGCFWHMHEGCKLSSIPKTNYIFWEEKLKRNVERDRKNYELLDEMGIKVIIVWGCKIKMMMKSKQKEIDTINEILSLMIGN